MSVHYEIHSEINGRVCKNLDHYYPKSFAGLDSRGDARKFATAGGARNYIKKWSITKAKPVKVTT